MPDEVVDDYDDPTENLRLFIIGLGLAANLVIIYWQVKDTAEMIELRAKLASWWDRRVTRPARRKRALQKAEAETVFEAMQVVEGGAA